MARTGKVDWQGARSRDWRHDDNGGIERRAEDNAETHDPHSGRGGAWAVVW